jgi:hypothetical protein
MSLPTNPQAMSASERLILETLNQQGETLSYQTKVLQSLTNQITRQRRNDEKVSKKQTPSSRVERNKKSSDDYLEKFKDYSAEVFGKAMGDIREYFASQTSNEKPTTVKMSETTKSDDTKNDKAKDKKSKNTDDRDIIKNILESMVVTNKYQEQLTENLKSLKTLSDKTLTSVSLIQDDINIIKTSNDSDNDVKINEKPASENPNKRTPLNTKTVNNNEPLDIIKFSKSIGLEVSSRLIPSVDKLGQTFTDNIEYAVNTLSEILINNQSNSVGADVDGSRRRGRAGSRPANSGTGTVPSPAPVGSNPLGAAAAAAPVLSQTLPFAASLLAAPVLLSTMDNPEDLDRMREKEKREKEAKKKIDDAKPTRESRGKLEKLKQVEPGEIIPFNGIEYIKQPDGTLADKAGKALPANIQKNVEDTYLKFLNTKGQSSVSFEREMTTKLNELNSSEKPNNTEVLNKEKLDNQKPRGGRGGAAAGEEEEYKRVQRVQRAEKLPKEITDWAEKRYKDINIKDPNYLGESKNSKILDWLEQNQDFIKRNPNYNLNKKEESNPEKVKSKSEKVSQNLNTLPMASILKTADNENAALTESTAIASAPIIVNNNTTVASSGSGSGMSFVSGSPVNTNTAINDFFRYNGRIFA